MIRLSAMPSSSAASRPSGTNGLNGSTAIDVIAAGEPGGCAGRAVATKYPAPISPTSIMHAIATGSRSR